MVQDNYEQFYQPRPGKGKRHSAKQNARDLVRKLTWLQHQPIVWGGAADAVPALSSSVWQPVTRQLQGRLRGNPAGLYALEPAAPEAGSMETQIQSIQAVHPQLLTDATAMLNQTAAHKRQISRLVDDYDNWIDLCRKSAAMFAKLSHAADETVSINGLLLEANCVWLGTAERRPSRQIPSPKLEEYLHDCVDSDATHDLAAVVLGTRPHTGSPKAYASQLELGKLLQKWEPDILVKLSGSSTAPAAVQLARQYPELTDPLWAEFVREYLLLSRRPEIDALLVTLPPLLEAWKNLCNEGRERRQCLLELFGQAVQLEPPVYRDGSTRRLRRNHEFDGACRELLRDHLSGQGLRLPQMDAGQDPVQTASRWVLGIDLDKDELDKFRSECIGDGKDFCVRFMEQLQALLPAEPSLPTDACRSLAVAAARLGARLAPGDALPMLAQWLDHCRTCSAPGPTGGDPVHLALGIINQRLADLETQEAMTRFLEILAKHGRFLLEAAANAAAGQGTPPDREFVQRELDNSKLDLALTAVPPKFDDFIPLLFEAGLTSWLQTVCRRQPEQLERAMKFLADVDDAWYRLPAGNQDVWAELLSLHHHKLAGKLTQWIQSLEAKGRFQWEDFDPLLRELLTFMSCRDDSGKRQQFLYRHFDLLLESLASVCRDGDANVAGWLQLERLCCRVPLFEIAYQWEQEGYDGIPRLFRRLLTRYDRRERQRQLEDTDEVQSYFPENVDVELSVALSGGAPKRLWSVLTRQPQQSHSYPSEPIQAWHFLSQRPAIRDFLRQLMNRPDVIVRVKLLLQRLALALRLHSTDCLRRELAVWETVGQAADQDIPRNTPPSQRDAMAQLLAWLDCLPNKSPDLPKSVSKILRRPQQLKTELQKLRQRIRTTTPSETVARRLEHLEQYVNEPQAMQDWIERDLKKELAKQLDLHRLLRLEQIAYTAMQEHWKLLQPTVDIYNDPDWDNALLLTTTVKQNRRLLNRLLRRAAKGNYQGFQNHPHNRRFLREVTVAGVDADKWCKPYERSLEIRSGRFRCWVEQNPLRILQMGNLFGTCLSVTGESAHAAVANAIEANKRVIYLANADDHIVGRKLLAMDRRGRVYSFHSYGRGIWLKIQLDRFCLDFIRNCGATLAPLTGDQNCMLEELQLFAKWYFDTPEPFDWWLAEAQSKADLQADLLRNFPKRMHQDEPAVMRALLVLGEEAIPVIKTHHAKLTPQACRRLQRETTDASLAEYLNRLP